MQKKQQQLLNSTSSVDAAGSLSAPKQKERRIVTWTPEEDDILREQINIHGTENWTIIASKFQDKTTRQCRRRWYSYLNSDFKKGGWSPEEDLLLCEAQKIFGNRWTEIAKVVSGRTDNAVKNRFTTLCKKRAKREALAKDNSSTYTNANNKRAILNSGFNLEGTLHLMSPLKKLRREHIPNLTETFNTEHISGKGCLTEKQQLRPPLALLPSNQATNVVASVDGGKKIDGTFLKKDDPKILALMQQAELLTSLATKVNAENTEQSLENAWKIVESYLNKSKENDTLQCNLSEVDLPLDQLNDLVEELRCGDHDFHALQRRHDLYDSPSSSEYSRESTILSANASEQFEQSQPEICTVHEDAGEQSQTVDRSSQNGFSSSENKGVDKASTTGEETLVHCAVAEYNGDQVAPLALTEFGSPLHTTPLFRSLAATVPSPQFSESERHFLMKTLGIESPATSKMSSNSQPPPCRRALVHSL